VQFGNALLEDETTSKDSLLISLGLIQPNEEKGLFSQEEYKPEKKRASVFGDEDKDNTWLKIEEASTKSQVQSLSPYPEQNVEFHKIFKVDMKEYVVECEQKHCFFFFCFLIFSFLFLFLFF
jgi:hypothetical protein